VKYSIILRRLAERDLTDAQDWYDQQRAGLGTELHTAIDQLFARLAENPWIYPQVHDDVHRAVLRRFPYLVYFLIEGSNVIILAALDRRDPLIHRNRSGG
jgi:plasmid stabilization system protein ParE